MVKVMVLVGRVAVKVPVTPSVPAAAMPVRDCMEPTTLTPATGSLTVIAPIHTPTSRNAAIDTVALRPDGPSTVAVPATPTGCPAAFRLIVNPPAVTLLSTV